MFRIVGIILALELLVGCGSHAAGAEAPATAASTTSDPLYSDASACEAVKDIVRVCYDNSSPDMSCADVYAVALTASFALDLPPSQQATVAELCTRSCDMRKSGVAWSSITSNLCA